MFGRSLKWTLVLLFALSVVLMTGGCLFGGGSTTTTLGTPTGIGTTTTPAVVGDILQPIEGLPVGFSQALTKQPIVVLFYVPGNADDTSVLDTINKLRASFGTYLFLTYDYKAPDSYGTLTNVFDISYAPYLALIDGKGALKQVFSGYVDEGTLNQSLVNLGK